MVVEDALAHELEKGTTNVDGVDVFPDDDDDESYREEAKDAAGGANAQIVQHDWDDEENIKSIKSITEGDVADCMQSSEDLVSLKGSGKATPGSITAKSH